MLASRQVVTLIKWAFLGAMVVGFIWFGRTVPLGKHTLFGHVERIWQSDETRDLVDGTREAARPAVEKVTRSVRAGVEAVREQDAAPARSRE